MSVGTSNDNEFSIERDFATRSRLKELFGKSERWWLRLERAGLGPPIVRLGRTPLYSLAAVRDWLTALEKGTVYRRGKKVRRRAKK